MYPITAWWEIPKRYEISHQRHFRYIGRSTDVERGSLLSRRGFSCGRRVIYSGRRVETKSSIGTRNISIPKAYSNHIRPVLKARHTQSRKMGCQLSPLSPIDGHDVNTNRQLSFHSPSSRTPIMSKTNSPTRSGYVPARQKRIYHGTCCTSCTKENYLYKSF